MFVSPDSHNARIHVKAGLIEADGQTTVNIEYGPASWVEPLKAALKTAGADDVEVGYRNNIGHNWLEVVFPAGNKSDAVRAIDGFLATQPEPVKGSAADAVANAVAAPKLVASVSR